jgi:hypothetical protein
VGIADDPGDAWEGGEFFGSALGVAAGDDEAGRGILGVKLANRVACLSVGGSGYRARVENNDGGRCWIGRGSAATIEELAFDSGAIGLRGAAAELLDVEARHNHSRCAFIRLPYQVP